MTDYRAGKSRRLKRRADISRLFDDGRRRSDGRMTLLAAPCAAGATGRFAVLVAKRHGSAVQRNRVKRLCREAFRLTRPELPDGFDYIILPRAGAELTLAGLQESLRSLAPKVASTTKTTTASPQRAQSSQSRIQATKKKPENKTSRRTTTRH